MSQQSGARFRLLLAAALACLVFVPSFWIVDILRAETETVATDGSSAIYFDESRANRVIAPDQEHSSEAGASEEWDPILEVPAGPADCPGHSAFAQSPLVSGLLAHSQAHNPLPPGRNVDVPNPPPDAAAGAL